MECLSFRHHPKATTYFIPVSRKTQAVNTLFALSRHHCIRAVKANINYTTSCDDNQEKKGILIDYLLLINDYFSAISALSAV